MLRGFVCAIVLTVVSFGTLLMADDKQATVAEKGLDLEVRTHFLQAHNLAEYGMYDSAIAEYKKVLELSPNLADVHFELGLAYVNTGQLDDAISEYEKALEIDPGYLRAVYELTLAYYDKGMTDEGIAFCRSYLKDSGKKKGNLHSILGVLYIKKGDTDSAIGEFKKQIEARHHPEMGYLNLGMALVKKEDYDGAIEAFQKSLELNNHNPRTHYQLGNAYLKKGMKAEGEKEMAVYKQLTGR